MQDLKQLKGLPQFKIIAILGFVLALDAADKATVSALAMELKSYFAIDNILIGLLIALVAFTTSLFTLPFGVLVDRFNRKRILLIAISCWTLLTVISGLATSFTFLIITRFFLGAVTAVAAPSSASLIGDFFPAHQRARMYGLILIGELLGGAYGFFISAEISYILNWRWSFYLMAIPSALLVGIIWRFLPEPERGGKKWLSRMGETKTQSAILQAGVKPRENLIIREDPVHKSLWWAFTTVIRIPTFVVLVIGSSLIYFFFSGLRAFSMIYLPEHYRISSENLTPLLMIPGAFAILGLLFGGNVSEWLFKHRLFNARIIVPAVALLLCIVFYGFGLWTIDIYWGICLLSFAVFFTAAANPPIDAARLDIIHPRLWGRAEAIRTALRAFFEGSAPLLFGFTSDWLGGNEQALFWTYMIMLIPLFIASLLAIPALFTYERDVATAAASASEVRSNHS